MRDYAGPAALPGYDRQAVTAGIAHIGIGAFHRAHQAVYADDILAGAPEWGIRGISLRRPDTRDALMPQDGLYTLGIRDGSGLSARIIGSVVDVVHGQQAAAAAIADPTIRLVTITVTEKGYEPDGALAAVLTAGLAARARNGGGPVTVLSCDNLPANGRRTEALVRAAAQTAAPELGGFLDAHVTFPSSMVDRITPATSDADRAEIAALTGLEDAWPVVTEPFSQWVIEDRFAADRPPFEQAGAQIVADVEPFETMKLRLLNGAHTTMAMLGPMLGHAHVAEAAADPDLAALIAQTAQTEVFATLTLSRDVLAPYWEALMQRFENPALRHALAQIGTDSSQKVPVRLVPPALDNRAAGRPCPGLVLAIAAHAVHVRAAARAGAQLERPAGRTASRGGGAICGRHDRRTGRGRHAARGSADRTGARRQDRREGTRHRGAGAPCRHPVGVGLATAGPASAATIRAQVFSAPASSFASLAAGRRTHVIIASRICARLSHSLRISSIGWSDRRRRPGGRPVRSGS